MEKYKTILRNACAEIEEKKSKFIANIIYVDNLQDIEKHIREIKKKYFDANHNCYAYRIIEKDGIKEKQSDDGEPSGTAGVPILNILNKHEIFNILVVVTRYFGGTLLGTGGLVRAYSQATLEAMKKTQIVMKQFGYEIELEIPYKDLERFKYYCSKRHMQIKNIVYENNVICNIELNEEEKVKLLDKNQKDIHIIKYTVLREKYIDINI